MARLRYAFLLLGLCVFAVLVHVEGSALPSGLPLSLSGGGTDPSGDPLALAEMTVPHHATVRRRNRFKAGAQPGNGLRRQRDFRHEKYHSPARAQGPYPNR